jgi:hypothetical protein
LKWFNKKRKWFCRKDREENRVLGFGAFGGKLTF